MSTLHGSLATLILTVGHTKVVVVRKPMRCRYVVLRPKEPRGILKGIYRGVWRYVAFGDAGACIIRARF